MSLNDLKAKIVKAANNAVTLEVRTIVGPIELDEENRVNTKVNPENMDQTKAMVSKVDLLQGDITTKMDPEFVTGDYQNLRSFHLEQEEKGQAIIAYNIELLRKLADFVADKANTLSS